MKITISGTPGSGKSVVGKIIAERLGYSFYDAGKVRREIAEKKGITLEKLNELSEKDGSSDIITDEITKRIGKVQDNFVFVGRMAFYFIPDAIKLFFKCDLNEAARRIMNDDRNEVYERKKEAIEKLNKRMKSDFLRYKQLYNVDYTKGSDIIIDTTNLTIEEVVNKIMEILK